MFLRSATGDVDTPFGREGRRRDALDERFLSLRLQVGSWTFETFNDSRGGKDRGPTYGARAFVTARPGERFYEWVFGGLLGLM